ncbi:MULTISPECIES: hypothetical protein [unclassified Rathayibacter]|uniref:hypothetical protein n=1 Tax=unclassified Rathayibacter TaxID=2609250 RepID=UPI000F4C7C31|nr:MULTISPECIES: hypothetical protein [unclassified Rathayibacter]
MHRGQLVLVVPADLGVFAVLLSRTGRQELRDQTARELGPVLAEEAARGVPLLRALELQVLLRLRRAAEDLDDA